MPKRVNYRETGEEEGKDVQGTKEMSLAEVSV